MARIRGGNIIDLHYARCNDADRVPVHFAGIATME
jgi:hypothetical protein